VVAHVTWAILWGRIAGELGSVAGLAQQIASEWALHQNHSSFKSHAQRPLKKLPHMVLLFARLHFIILKNNNDMQKPHCKIKKE
jgi:Na+-transporting NADH:ubiquinone oxidoreductase subunit NqrB